MASEWERTYEEARNLHQAGRLEEALPLYQHVVAGNPGHGGAMHMLGLLAYQIGRTDTAVDLLGQAAVLDPLVGAVHSNLGLALKARGRVKEAEASFRRALLLSPQPETHANLGHLLLDQGRLDEALTNFRAATSRNPDLASAQAGLGDVLWKLGRAAEAEAAQEKAAQLEPASETLANLALLAFARGDAETALSRIGQALAAGETPRAKAVFAALLHRLRWDRDNDAMRAVLEQALSEGWARPVLLLPPAADLVKLRLREGGTPESDTLLHLMLVTAPNCDADLEQMLTALRRQLVRQPENRDLVFAAALARQCFINEYAFAEEAGERDKAEALARGIETALAADDVVPAAALLAVACYRPLHTLRGAEKLLDKALPDPLEPVLQQQVAEPLEEKRLAESLAALTAIADDAVKAQYEENPYPRWVRMDMSEQPVPLAQYLGKRFTAFDAAGLPLLPDMLFAGCGTGRFTLELSRRHPAQSRLAIDVSRAALGYAARKAAEAGVMLELAQADILRLPETKKRFSMIESSGVLHHLDDPFAGWAALAACLTPGGVMRLSLYSRLGRAPVRTAQGWVRREGFTATPDGIRLLRQRLLTEKPAEAAPVIGAADFYSVGSCRDLLFHVREHDLTLEETAAFLKESGLRFLGFETGEDVLGAYRARFPDDLAAVDLGNWATIEAEYPAIFSAMYQFWVQKP